MYTIINFYKFFPFSKAAQEELSIELRSIEAEDSSLGGLVLLSDEGINVTAASSGQGATMVLERCGSYTDLSSTLIKRHRAPQAPFRRFTIDRRAEIITYRGDESKADPRLFEDPNETFLSPREWHHLLDSGEPVTLIDTRNDYEVRLGTFRGAQDPGIKRFSDLVPWLEKNPPPPEQKVLIFCTGGVRCEKVAIDLKGQGYQNVFQLHGGILAYLEEFPEGYFDGECFVFDHRVAVDKHLQPSGNQHLCALCGDPTLETRSCSQCNTTAAVCEGCVQRHGVAACSKNCLYHLRRRAKTNDHTTTAG